MRFPTRRITPRHPPDPLPIPNGFRLAIDHPTLRGACVSEAGYPCVYKEPSLDLEVVYKFLFGW